MNTQLDSITHELFDHNAIKILDGGEASRVQHCLV